MRDDLENIYMLLFGVRRERLPAGALQRGLACDPETRRSRAGSHRLRAMVAARLRRASLQLSRHIRRRRCFLRICNSDVYQQPIASFNSLAVCCPLLLVTLRLPFCPMPYHKSTGRVTLAMRWTA